MATVIFNYKGGETKIQCNKEDKMKNICLKFISKNKIDININQFTFIYGGKIVNLELSFLEQANSLDKTRNEMYIIAYDNSNTILSEANNSEINSKEIICPQCSENCRICFKNFKISLYQCKNKHRIDNIPLNLFKNTQKIKESEIVCNNCNKINKSISYNHQFFKCFTCNKNLCPICSSTHIKSHAIIDYNKKNYFCNIHNDSFISYCSKCQINLCLSCESKHKEHKIISFSDIFPNIDDIKTEMNNFKNMIDIFKNDINKIIKILTEIISAFDNYYKINYDIINNFQIQNRNYEILQNINEVKNNIKINNKIKEINNINNIINKFKAIIILYNEINKKEFKVNVKMNQMKSIIKNLKIKIILLNISLLTLRFM